MTIESISLFDQSALQQDDPGGNNDRKYFKAIHTAARSGFDCGIRYGHVRRV